MTELRSIFLFAVLFLEAGLLFASKVLAADPKIYFELAARYSARLSFFILCGILLWTGITGLMKIFRDEKRRSFFIFLFILFAINHLIHFAFLYLNYQANQWVLFSADKMPGVIAYSTIVFFPVVLWKLKKPKFFVYFITYFYLGSIIAFFVITYKGRIGSNLPHATSDGVFTFFLISIALLAILNFFQITKELFGKKSPNPY